MILLRIFSDEAKNVTLRLWVNDHEEKYPMKRERDAFSYKLRLPDEACLVWYYFIVEKETKTVLYGSDGKNLGGEGVLSEWEPPSFQITVYDAAYKTPTWMHGGTMMQIMVDRFHKSESIKGKAAPYGGKWHEDWYEKPMLDIQNGDNAANDFYGGDLNGLSQKLQYLKRMGISVLYLNPIFASSSNHKYNTIDYNAIDPYFGSEEDFQALCEKAKKLGMHIILDGVFSHTGWDSVYFQDAIHNAHSPYRAWYTFKRYPDDYECWWGFPSLPTVNKNDPSYREYILGENGICAKYIRLGASGWRLDVADELPMPFLREMRRRVKDTDKNACLLGEVWEDASNKVAYGQLRTYCAGDTLDSVMDYPLRTVLLDFLLYKASAHDLALLLRHMLQCYPKPFLESLMHLLGSHDKARVISVLADAGNMEPLREERYDLQLTPAQYETGKRRFVAAWKFLSALPGMPSMYYGDEAGLTGMTDPFCRASYPWDREDKALLSEIREINLLRKKDKRMRSCDMEIEALSEDAIAVIKDKTLCCVLNRSETEIACYGHGVQGVSCAVFAV